MAQPAPLLLRRKAAAEFCGIPLRTFDQMDATGAIGPESVRISKAKYWKADELREWVASARNGSLPDRRAWRDLQKMRRAIA